MPRTRVLLACCRFTHSLMRLRLLGRLLRRLLARLLVRLLVRLLTRLLTRLWRHLLQPRTPPLRGQPWSLEFEILERFESSGEAHRLDCGIRHVSIRGSQLAVSATCWVGMELRGSLRFTAQTTHTHCPARPHTHDTSGVNIGGINCDYCGNEQLRLH